MVAQALVDFIPILAPDLDFLLLKGPSSPDRLSTAENVVEKVVKPAPNSPATMWWLPRIADLSRVDLFHATFNIMPAGLKMPCVTTIHDLMWLAQPELCRARMGAAIDTWFYQHGINRALKHSAAIASVSQATKDAIAQISPAAGKRTYVTLPGVDAPSTEEPQLAGEDIWLRDLPRFVLVVGQYAPYKNHEGAIAGFAAAFHQQENIHLIFVQRMNGNAHRLAELTTRQGVNERVHFLGSVGSDTLAWLYRHAELLLHPSFCEGFGLPLAEALSSGCPVVTSNQSAMPEVVGDAAILVDPKSPEAIGAALSRMVGNASLQQDLRAKGRVRAASLKWQNFAQANLNIYRKVIAR
jgi:alpha-1,3-rhamnosyl/mannosyltransferase